jgi:hypothetical protein
MKNLGALNYAAALNSAARRSKLPGEQIAGAECREQVDAPADVEVFSLDIPFHRTADQPEMVDEILVCNQLRGRCVSAVCLLGRVQEVRLSSERYPSLWKGGIGAKDSAGYHEGGDRGRPVLLMRDSRHLLRMQGCHKNLRIITVFVNQRYLQPD